jgi:hypothetical protein
MPVPSTPKKPSAQMMIRMTAMIYSKFPMVIGVLDDGKGERNLSPHTKLFLLVQLGATICRFVR